MPQEKLSTVELLKKAKAVGGKLLMVFPDGRRIVLGLQPDSQQDTQIVGDRKYRGCGKRASV